ncbi:PREDICTED: lymphocyte antigen 6 complex locus protein G6c [Miniopterus natalensis]|uniref:lymphocyte antigen 6 complex locus protein G6c n=1 Tax=Miniopterus natalensis TaxID=291302 RepID=UPI0007A6FB38|nr:PREDICTED: lymphocyte antigen 6 complex locus protein G6c [Miniopterus natalensis]
MPPGQSSWATPIVHFPGTASCYHHGHCNITGAFGDASSEDRGLGKQGCWLEAKLDPQKSTLSAAAVATILRTLTMKGLLLLTLSSLFCWVSADIRCHSCYKVPVLGCVDRQSCRLEQGQKCLTTNVYLGKMWVFSNLRCGTPEEPCREAFNQTNHKLGLTYNTTCCNKDNCNSPAPRPTPALALVLLTSLAGLGLWLLH